MISEAKLHTCPDLLQSQRRREVLSQLSPPRTTSLILETPNSPESIPISSLNDDQEDKNRLCPDCACPKMDHTRECCVIALKCLFRIEAVDHDSAEQQILVLNRKDKVSFSVVKTSNLLLACAADEDKKYLPQSNKSKNDQEIAVTNLEMRVGNKGTLSTLASGDALQPTGKLDSLSNTHNVVNVVPPNQNQLMISSITEVPTVNMTEFVPGDYFQDLIQTTNLSEELLISNDTFAHSSVLENDLKVSPKKEPLEQLRKICSLENQQIKEENKAHSLVVKMPNQNQSASLSNSRRNSEDAVSIINKDINRSFQNIAYFKNPSIQFLLKELLMRVSESFPEIGYIQGINYIACGVTYHCQHYVKAWKIIDFLFRRLQMNNIYHLESFEVHVILLKRLFKVTNHRLFEKLERVINLDLKILLLEWYYCLGFNRVPLEYSHMLLEGLTTYGWFFFYRLLYHCIDLALQSVSSRLHSQSLNDHHKFEIEYQLKNFHKTSVNWIEVLTECLTVELDDQLIAAHLRWIHSDCFTMIN